MSYSFEYIDIILLAMIAGLIFLVGGKIINNPNISVAKPGKIKSKAAKASAAPQTIS